MFGPSGSTRWNLVRKRGDGTPPVDIALLALGLLGLAGLAFWSAIISQFAGPVVEDGVSPQTVAGVRFSLLGIASLALSVAVYQRRPVGWIGTFVGGVLGLYVTTIGWFDIVTTHTFAFVGVLTPPLVLCYLFLRRSVFFE